MIRTVTNNQKKRNDSFLTKRKFHGIIDKTIKGMQFKNAAVLYCSIKALFLQKQYIVD